MNKWILFPATLFLALSSHAADLACEIKADGCTEILQRGSDGTIWKDYTNSTAVMAGKTLCIPGGDYKRIAFKNLKGSSLAPVKIVNCGGQVRAINTTYPEVLRVEGGRYLKITGSGVDSVKYGIYLKGSKGSTLDAGYGVSDIEIERVEAEGNLATNLGYGGIVVRTYPTCSGKYFGPGVIQENTYVHDCYVHDVVGEGLYIGPSHYHAGFKTDCNGDGVNESLPEGALKNTHIARVLVERSGRDGIQVGASIEGTKVHDNTVIDWGLKAVYGHTTGLLPNPGTQGEWYNNVVIARSNHAGSEIAFQTQGAGDSYYYNNLLVGGNYGIMILRNTGAGGTFHFFHNTVLNSRLYGIKVFCNSSPKNIFGNNIFAQYGDKQFTYGDSGRNCVTLQTNLFYQNTYDVGFVSPAAEDFHLQASSLAVDGAPYMESLVGFDLDQKSRLGQPYDFGAYSAVRNHAPQLSLAAEINVVEGQSVQLSVSASDADGDALAFSEIGMPSYMTLTSQSGNTRVYRIAPPVSATDADVDVPVTIKVSDALSAAESNVVIHLSNLVVAAPLYQSMQINFQTSSVSSVPAGWLNAPANCALGASMALKDKSGAVTPYSLAVTQGFTSAKADGGHMTSNDSGPMPDSVLKGYCYVEKGTAKLKLKGLSLQKKYQISMMASRSAQSGVRNTLFQIGGQSVAVNAIRNNSVLATFSNLVSNAAGEIEISVSNADAASVYGYLNGLVVSESLK